MTFKNVLPKFIIYSIIIIMASSASAQTTGINNYLPPLPSPEAAGLGKFGQVPVSYYNGTPSIEIPIYTVKCNDLQVPITLSYNASGNKPDEHPGWVGLGWNLNAGGVITRIINGWRDEVRKADIFRTWPTVGLPSDTIECGYYYMGAKDISVSNWLSDSFCLGIANEIDGSNRLYTNHYFDMQPDEYLFNFGGISGSFYFTYENGKITTKIKCKEGTVLKIEPVLMAAGDHSLSFDIFKQLESSPGYNQRIVSPTFLKFILTTIDGTRYEFGGYMNDIDFATQRSTLATSWHLSKIVSTKNDSIVFNYKDGGDIFVLSKGHYLPPSFYSECPPVTTTGANEKCYSLSMIHPKYLSSITTSANQTINFISSPSKELWYDNDWETMSTTLYPSVPNLLAENYSNIPADLNTLKDYAKTYYKLDRIEIPNVKYVNFFYTSDTTQRLKLNTIADSYNQYIPTNVLDSNIDNRYLFSYNQYRLPKYNSEQTDDWGYYNGRDYSLLGKNIDDSIFIAYRCPDTSLIKAEMLEKINYPTGGYTLFDYEAAYFSKVLSMSTYYNIYNGRLPFSTFDSTGFAGGVRIRSIYSYSGNDEIPSTSKYFSYFSDNNGSTGGILSWIPKTTHRGFFLLAPEIATSYLNIIEQRQKSGSMYTLYSQELISPLSYTNGGPITYPKVIEHNSDGSKTNYTFLSYNDHTDEFPLKLVQNFDDPFIENLSSHELERGLLSMEEDYNSSDQLVKQISYDYNSDPNRYNTFVRSINVNFYPILSQNPVAAYRFSAARLFTFYPYLKSRKVTTYSQVSSSGITEITNYSYDTINHLIDSAQTINSKEDTILVINKYPQNDISNATSNAMVSSNILAPIIETLTINKKSGENTIDHINYFSPYSGMFLPQSISRQIGNGSMQTMQLFNLYDAHGHILETQKPNDFINTYIWGYNDQYPIAEIKGSGYSVVSGIVNQNQINSAIASGDIAVRALLNNLRTGLSGAQINTYTYKPFIGMTSETDPSGRTSYYEYDETNRLSTVYDLNKAVIKKYKYNVMPPPNWQNTNPIQLRCQTYTGINTGYQEVLQTDTNPISPSFNSTRWIVYDKNNLSCPLPAIEIPCFKFSIDPNYSTAISSQIINNGIGVTGNYKFSLPIGMAPGTTWIFGTIIGCRLPTSARTFNLYDIQSNTNWILTLNPNGNLSGTLTLGNNNPLPQNKVIFWSSFTFPF